VNVKFLNQYPEFKEFHTAKKASPAEEVGEDSDDTETKTPEEALEGAFERLRSELATEIIARIKACPPEFFERLVITLLLKMGYGGSRADAGRAIGRTGDGGIDGIIDEDRLGLDSVYIQAKRWEGNVSRPEIQKFVGALHGHRARKGVFITTSGFTSEAIDYAKGVETRVVLIDGQRLSELMIDFGVGVSIVATYEIKKIDEDFFADL
jgi:restriction system protein